MIAILYMPVMLLSPIWVINSFSCKAFVGMFSFILRIQAFITAISSFDRLITTLKPHNYHFKNKMEFQITVMLFSVLFAFLLNLPSFSYYDAVSFKNTKTCSYINQSGILYFKLEYFIFRITIPFFTMIISSIGITWKVCKIKSNRKKEKNHFKALIFHDIFFIFFRLPMLFYLLFNQNGINVISDFLYSILVVVGLLNNVLVFLIFYLFNKFYRQIFNQYIYFQCISSKVQRISSKRIPK